MDPIEGSTVHMDAHLPLQKFRKFGFSPEITITKLESLTKTLPAANSDANCDLTYLLTAVCKIVRLTPNDSSMSGKGISVDSFTSYMLI